MCRQVYIGSNQVCREIPFVPRTEAEIEADVNKYYAVNLFVHAHLARSGFHGKIAALSTPYHYHAGIMGCGCGFVWDYPARGYVRKQARKMRNDQRQLNHYIARCLQDVEFVEIFSCWIGDEALPVETQHITLKAFQSPEFYFVERQLTVVHRNAQHKQTQIVVDHGQEYE